ALPSQSPRLSPDSHIPDYFLRFSPVVMPVKVARCFHDHTGWFNNIRRNILMATLSSCGYVYLAVYPTPEMKN
ncbi:TPA: hypothetical protein ACNEII_004929, partial [Escherichia coli]